LSTLDQARDLVSRQNAELELMVPDKTIRTLFRRIMGAVLTGFVFLTKDQMRLFVKFLIEGIDELEKVEPKDL
jgi:hypothetical protein